jgi:hypothetical protein
MWIKYYDYLQLWSSQVEKHIVPFIIIIFPGNNLEASKFNFILSYLTYQTWSGCETLWNLLHAVNSKTAPNTNHQYSSLFL